MFSSFLHDINVYWTWFSHISPMNLIWEFYSPNAKQSISDWIHFTKRTSTKAIIMDDEGNMAFIRVGKWKYYTIPWWWVEDGETMIEWLHRECMEEVWVEIEPLQEIWYTRERRAPQDRRKQTKKWREKHSYAYVCKLIWEIWTPSFSKKEIRRWFTIDRLPIDDVIQLFKDALTRDIEEEYASIKVSLERNLLILKRARELIT